MLDSLLVAVVAIGVPVGNYPKCNDWSLRENEVRLSFKAYKEKS
jgi:hypothetical protein